MVNHIQNSGGVKRTINDASSTPSKGMRVAAEAAGSLLLGSILRQDHWRTMISRVASHYSCRFDVPGTALPCSSPEVMAKVLSAVGTGQEGTERRGKDAVADGGQAGAGGGP